MRVWYLTYRGWVAGWGGEEEWKVTLKVRGFGVDDERGDGSPGGKVDVDACGVECSARRSWSSRLNGVLCRPRPGRLFGNAG